MGPLPLGGAPGSARDRVRPSVADGDVTFLADLERRR